MYIKRIYIWSVNVQIKQKIFKNHSFLIWYPAFLKLSFSYSPSRMQNSGCFGILIGPRFSRISIALSKLATASSVLRSRSMKKLSVAIICHLLSSFLLLIFNTAVDSLVLRINVHHFAWSLWISFDRRAAQSVISKDEARSLMFLYDFKSDCKPH